MKCNAPCFFSCKNTITITAIIASTVTVPNTPPTIAAVLSPPDLEDTVSYTRKDSLVTIKLLN